MTTIYLVWSGSYSDAHVIAAFSDESVAEALADKTLDGSTSECELNPADTDALISAAVMWRAEFSPNGDLLEVSPTYDDTEPDEDNYENKASKRGRYIVYFRAIDRKAAKKAAPDHSPRWLANRPPEQPKSPPGPMGSEVNKYFTHRGWTAPILRKQGEPMRLRIVAKMDDQTCETCRSHHGREVDLDNAGPHDLPPFHDENSEVGPCRCSFVEVTEKNSAG